MNGIGWQEIAWLVVLALLFTPPDKIPELSRKAARVIYFVRNIANNATDQLKAELGPEYADLDLTDLNPKTFVQKHLLDSLQDEIDSVRAEVEGIRNDITNEINDVRQAVRGSGSEGGSADDLDGVQVLETPFDSEAT